MTLPQQHQQEHHHVEPELVEQGPVHTVHEGLAEEGRDHRDVREDLLDGHAHPLAAENEREGDGDREGHPERWVESQRASHGELAGGLASDRRDDHISADHEEQIHAQIPVLRGPGDRLMRDAAA